MSSIATRRSIILSSKIRLSKYNLINNSLLCKTTTTAFGSIAATGLETSCYFSTYQQQQQLNNKTYVNLNGGNKLDENYNSNANNNKKSTTRKLIAVFGAATALVAVGIYKTHSKSSQNVVHAEQVKLLPEFHKTIRADLPTYKMTDVSEHNSIETKVWVTYGIGVYDITTFIPEHPGSDKIMLAAGSAIDPFWHIFQQHNTPEIVELLERYRIGNLCAEDDVGTKDLQDPWANEPKRHPILRPASQKPFNAEPPSSILTESFITPTEFFYVRNHLPVPDVDITSYELDIEIEGSGTSKTLSFEDVRQLPKHSITAAVMCGGNRRSEMHKVKAVKGLSWGAAAVGNAVWSGPKLCDILKSMGVESDEKRHVHFEGLDIDPTGTSYAASIPLSKAMDPRGDVILAYEMNGQPLSHDHGYPIRIIVPGVVGARNVKWVGRIVVSESESPSHWQQNDYKGFSPSTDWDTVDFSKSPAIQNMPVTSAICTPQDGETIKRNGGFVTVKGYAWSGGGNKIVRVDVTGDCGKTWHVAELEHDAANQTNNCPTGRNWAWALWTVKIPVDENVKEIELWSKAADSNYNVQPESFENTWNLRGVLSHAYNRICVKVTK